MALRYRLYQPYAACFLRLLDRWSREGHPNVRGCQALTRAIFDAALSARRQGRLLRGLLAFTAYYFDQLHYRNIDSPTDRNLLMMEAWAYRHSFPTLFPVHPDLPDLVYRSNFLVEPDSLTLPFDGTCTLFVPPLGSLVEGLALDPALLVLASLDRLLSNWRALVAEGRRAGLLSPETERELEEHFNALRLQAPPADYLFIACGAPNPQEPTAYVSYLARADAERCLNDPARYRAMKRDFRLVEGRPDPATRIEYDEAERVRVLARTYAGLGCYALAFPAAVEEGLPDLVKLRDLDQDKARPKRIARLHAPEPIKPSARMHLRAGHFRVYRHERYRRDPEGRFVVQWIDETTVGGTLDPKTVRKRDGETPR